MLCAGLAEFWILKCLVLLVKDQQQTEIWQHLVQVYSAHNGCFIIVFFTETQNKKNRNSGHEPTRNE